MINKQIVGGLFARRFLVHLKFNTYVEKCQNILYFYRIALELWIILQKFYIFDSHGLFSESRTPTVIFGLILLATLYVYSVNITLFKTWHCWSIYSESQKRCTFFIFRHTSEERPKLYYFEGTKLPFVIFRAKHILLVDIVKL